MRHRSIPVAVVSTIMYIEPASAVVWAVLFLGESPNGVAWVGILMVVVGGVIAASTSRNEEIVIAPPHLSGQ